MKSILGKKIGMTQVFQPDGSVVPVTVIEAGPCWVTQIKTEAAEGYSAVQIGFGEVAAKLDGRAKDRKIERRLNKARRGHLGLLAPSAKHPTRKKLAVAVPALRVLREVRVDNTDEYQEGQKITVEVFQAGDRVDVIGTSKGKGWAGPIKRHHFHRQSKTHGASDRTRAQGSMGTTTTPGHTPKGKRMGGRMGNQRVTQQNLEVVVVDASRNLLAVRGSIPGAKGGVVMVRATNRKR